VTLLKSLFCQKGKDNRSRYAVINTVAYVSFIALSLIFSNSSLLLIFSLLISVYTSSLTTLRRLNDSILKQKWFFTPAVSFLIFGLLIVTTQLSIFYWLLLLSAISSSVLLTYPSKKQIAYIYGYHGPINIIKRSSGNTYQQRAANRVEPTIVHNELLSTKNLSEQSTSTSVHNAELPAFNEGQDIGEVIRIYTLKHRVLFATVFALFLVTIISGYFYSQSNQAVFSEPNNEINDKQKIPTRLHAINLPDNFSIMLSEFKGVIISWQGDTNEKSQFWSQASAQGDSSCQSITFNNGDDVRTLSVISNETGEFYANFSPLDTKSIVNNVAFRGKFTLCGYSFSLKGSQAVLGKHKIYSELISY